MCVHPKQCSTISAALTCLILALPSVSLSLFLLFAKACWCSAPLHKQHNFCQAFSIVTLTLSVCFCFCEVCSTPHLPFLLHPLIYVPKSTNSYQSCTSPLLCSSHIRHSTRIWIIVVDVVVLLIIIGELTTHHAAFNHYSFLMIDWQTLFATAGYYILNPALFVLRVAALPPDLCWLPSPLHVPERHTHNIIVLLYNRCVIIICSSCHSAK